MPVGKELFFKMTTLRNLPPISIAAYCWGLLAALSFVKYSTPKSFYRSAYFDVLNPGVLVNDIYLHDHISLKSSLFYDAVSFLKLPLYDDAVGLIFFLAVSALSLWMTYLIIREYCNVTEPAMAMVITLLLGFSYNKILMTVHGGATTLHAVPQNALAHGLGLAALYFMMGRKIAIAAFCITVVLLVAPKGGFLLLLIALLYFLFTRTLKLSDVLAMSVPVIAVVALSGKIAYPENADALIRICERVIEREDYEVAYHLQPLSALGLFIASLIATPFLARRVVNPDVRRLFWCVSIVTAGVFLFGLFYVTVGYKIYPNPQLIMLSPVRAAKFHIFLFSLVALVWILNNPQLTWTDKIGAAIAFLVLRGDTTGIGYASIVLMITFVVSKMPALTARITASALSTVPVTIVIPLIVTAFFIQQLPRSYPVADMDLQMYTLTGQWTRNSNISIPALKDFKRLAAIRDDFVLLGYYKDHDRYRPVLNPVDLMARKSSFIGEPATFYHRPKLWDEAIARQHISDGLADALSAGKMVPQKIISALHDRNVRVMVPRDAASFFSASIPQENIGSHILFKP